MKVVSSSGPLIDLLFGDSLVDQSRLSDFLLDYPPPRHGNPLTLIIAP